MLTCEYCGSTTETARFLCANCNRELPASPTTRILLMVGFAFAMLVPFGIGFFSRKLVLIGGLGAMLFVLAYAATLLRNASR